jgi:hypothetical protein
MRKCEQMWMGWRWWFCVVAMRSVPQAARLGATWVISPSKGQPRGLSRAMMRCHSASKLRSIRFLPVVGLELYKQPAQSTSAAF